MFAKTNFVGTFLCVIVIACAATSATAEPSERELINKINAIDNESSLYLFGGLSVEKSSSASAQSSGRSDEGLVERAIRYVRSHELKFTVPEENAEIEGVLLYREYLKSLWLFF